MNIKINIEKKHLYILIILILILGIGYVVASNWTGSGKPQSHTTLWTKEIKGKDQTFITVFDDFIVNQKVGIGTNVLADKLNVAGVIQTFDPTQPNRKLYLGFHEGSVGPDYSYLSSYDTATSSWENLVLNAGGAQYIGAEGNVGIGTNAPKYPLHISATAGNLGQGQIRIESPTYASSRWLTLRSYDAQNIGASNGLNIDAGQGMSLRTGWNEATATGSIAIIIDPSGNVVIPSSLRINKNLNVDGSSSLNTLNVAGASNLNTLTVSGIAKGQGVKINDYTTTKPTCNAANEGLLWYRRTTVTPPPIKGIVEVCRFNNPSYEWVSLSLL